MSLWMRFATASVAAFALSACVDTTPIDYTAPDAADGGASDGPTDGAASDTLVAACAECVTAGACQATYAPCEKDAKCAAFVKCLDEAYCWTTSPNGNLADLPPCIVTCGLKAGITGQDDPSVALFTPLYACVAEPSNCAGACDIGGDP